MTNYIENRDSFYEALVIYDSLYGNTEQIARAIAGALGTAEDVGSMHAGNMNLEQLRKSELVIVGSPTQGGRPTQAV